MAVLIHVDAYSGYKANERPRQFTLDDAGAWERGTRPSDVASATASSEPRSPLTDYRRWVIEAWAVHVATTAGVFEALRTPRALDELVLSGGYDPSALRALVRGLVACGHLTLDERDVCTLTESARRYFLRGSDSYLGDALSFLRTTNMYQSYPNILREGGSIGLTDEQWSYVTRGSAMYARAGVKTIIRAYSGLARREDLRLLDVGCGQGTYLLELGKVLPRMQAVGIDPTLRVVEDARSNVKDLAPRIRIEHARLVDICDQFDVVLINQVFHVIGVSESKALLENARKRLVPGGRVFVQEIVMTGDEPATALFGFNMRLLFDRGTVLDIDEIVTLMVESGFDDVRVHPIPGPTPGLVYVSGEAPLEEGRSQ
jgi:SAM-dependent methyltransferase